MGAARQTGSHVLAFLAEIREHGVGEALARLHLRELSGRPIREVFLGIMEVVCPPGASVEEAIARSAFVETIAELAQAGIASLDGLTDDQMRTVFELYVTHTIEARLFNDIGTKGLVLPIDLDALEKVESQVCEFVRGAVRNAVGRVIVAEGLARERVVALVDTVYETSFDLLRRLGEALAE